MKHIKLILGIGLVMVLIVACATAGADDQENNTQANQQHNQEQNQDTTEDQNTQNNQISNTGQTNKPEEGSEGGEPSGNEPASFDGGLWETEFGSLLASGDLVVESILANNPDSETVGTILTVQFTNLSSNEIIASLPCGLVFTPTQTDEQALMMIQPLEINLAGGETAEYTPFVVCIELAAPAPSLSSTYSIGYLESDDLLAFAECVCGEKIDDFIGSMDPVGVQFAAWSVATQGDLTSLVDEEGSSIGDYLEGIEGSEAVTAIFEMMSAFSSEWLDRCGSTIEAD